MSEDENPHEMECEFIIVIINESKKPLKYTIVQKLA